MSPRPHNDFRENRLSNRVRLEQEIINFELFLAALGNM